MKRVRVIVVLVILLLTGVAAIAWFSALAGARRTAAAGGAAPASQAATADSAAASRGADRWSEGLLSVFRDLNHGGIVFHGRAVDQHGDPVPGARVKGTASYNTGLGSGTRLIEAVTDADGRFTVQGVDGQSLSLELEKEGYEFNPNNALFWYSALQPEARRHQPDPANPVPLAMWRLQGAGNLVHYVRYWEFPADGTAFRLNLATAKTAPEGGDLSVTLTREPAEVPVGATGFAWTARLEAVDGGVLLMPPQPYYNLAPESGYRARIDHHQPAHREGERWNWNRLLEGELFARLGNGTSYARIRLRLAANAERNPGEVLAGLRLEVWLNPTGSRNLEYDPRKEIVPPR